MNISNMKNFVNAKNDILKCFAHAVAQATDEVVGDMSEANFLYRIESLIYFKKSIYKL